MGAITRHTAPCKEDQPVLVHGNWYVFVRMLDFCMVVPCNRSFTVRLVHQDVSVCWQEWGQEQGEGLDVWLQSRDTAGLQQAVDKMGGKLSVVLDGKTYTLEAGKHFHTLKCAHHGRS